MKLRWKVLPILFLMVLALPACHKEPPPPPAPPVKVSAPPPKAEPPPPVTAVAPAATPQEPILDRLPAAPDDSSLKNPVHKELTSAVHLYNMDNRRMPQDFNTLVKEKYIKAMPQPPPGKRFALDRRRMQVVIVDNQ